MAAPGPSSLHANVEPASEEANETATVSSATVPDGPDWIVVSGAAVSGRTGTGALR